ncbi:helix-turn-helix domain-containing protein [Lacipirellula sp.]|uniref:helix-turn-helix domain-containing protein n=1 Tax=Lacipirellula sp. TaxID=2691419 RepID=UPI003D107F09
MPSLQPHGAKLANLRRALGLTQLELAVRSGVSERTIRNAERGNPLKRSFLEFIADGLGVPVTEIIIPCAEVDLHLRWKRHVERLTAGLKRVAEQHDSSDLYDLAHRDITMQIETHLPNFSAGAILRGEYRGIEGVQQFVENGYRFWEVCGDGDYYVEAPTGGGDVVVMRGGQQVRLDDGRQQWMQFLYVFQFEQERLLRMDEYLAPGHGRPAATPLILSSDQAQERRFESVAGGISDPEQMSRSHC